MSCEPTTIGPSLVHAMSACFSVTGSQRLYPKVDTWSWNYRGSAAGTGLSYYKFAPSLAGNADVRSPNSLILIKEKEWASVGSRLLVPSTPFAFCAYACMYPHVPAFILSQRFPFLPIPLLLLISPSVLALTCVRACALHQENLSANFGRKKQFMCTCRTINHTMR